MHRKGDCIMGIGMVERGRERGREGGKEKRRREGKEREVGRGKERR